MEEWMKKNDLFDLSGKVAMISGGAQGIGRAMTMALAEAGADIMVFSRNGEKCEALAHEVEKIGVKTMAVACDITCPEDVQKIVCKTREWFGHIDILVNNAGRTWGAAPEDVTDEAWEKVFDLNVTGTFRLTRQVGGEMIRQKKGKIINISSYAGGRGTDPNYMDALPYNSSKGAINTFTKDLAVKWACRGIQVNAIAPGWFPTCMTKGTFDQKGDAILADIPMGRYGQPEELGGAVVFLSSNASDYVTGQIIGVDGGLSAW